MPKRIAVYPGTFDPITFGHIEIIKKASLIFDTLIVAVSADTPLKKTLFSVEERFEMVDNDVKLLVQQEKPFSNHQSQQKDQAAINEANYTNIKVKIFHGLLVDIAQQEGASTIVRGIRGLSDFEFEFQMAYINNKLNSNIQTVLIPSTENGNFISSSFVKAVAQLNGNLEKFASQHVIQCLHKAYNNADEK